MYSMAFVLICNMYNFVHFSFMLIFDSRSHLKQVFVRKTRECLVIFPEGGFLRKRKVSTIYYYFNVEGCIPLRRTWPEFRDSVPVIIV